MKNAIIGLLGILMASNVSAHPGHDTPGNAAALNGGIVKSAGAINLELVSDASGVKIYPSHEGQAVSPKEVTLTGMVVPKGKKAAKGKNAKKEEVKFTVEGDHFMAAIDAKGASRYALELNATYNGKKEKASFEVELQ